MADKKTTSPAAETPGDDDELIHVPEGQSRLRYLLTIGLVLFLLVIFVVADNFQNAMTGTGVDQGDSVWLTWEDPLTGETIEQSRNDLNRTGQGLEVVMRLGMYQPPSFTTADPASRSSRPDVEQEDIAAFLVMERMAEGTGIDVSDEELKERLGMVATTELLSSIGRTYRMNGRDIAEMTRRVLRVQKLRAAIEAPFAVNDSVAAVAEWQEQVPEYRFQVVTARSESFMDAARAEVPDDEELLRWFREDLAINEQRALYTPDRVVPEAVYLDLDDGSFDSSALFAAYPINEDVDQGALARSYYDFNRRLRFMPEESEGEGEGDDGDDGDEGGEDDSEAPQEPLPFEEVEERALREARLNSAMGAFLTDVLDRSAAGEEEVDFTAEAAALGLTVAEVDPEGYTREEVEAAEGWGSRQISGQLMFTGAGSFITRVVVSPSTLTIVRVAEKFPAAEPPLEDMREELVELWAKRRAGELAVESLEAARESLAERPEGLGEEDQWTPTIDAAELEAYANENGLGWYVRPYLSRGMVPELEEGQEEVSPEDKFVQMNFGLYELEPGQVPAPATGRDGENAFLVRFDSQREKPATEITARQHLGYRDRVRQQQTTEFQRSYLPGDSPWMLEQAKVRWPGREAQEAEAEGEGDDGEAG